MPQTPSKYLCMLIKDACSLIKSIQCFIHPNSTNLYIQSIYLELEHSYISALSKKAFSYPHIAKKIHSGGFFCLFGVVLVFLFG